LPTPITGFFALEFFMNTFNRLLASVLMLSFSVAVHSGDGHEHEQTQVHEQGHDEGQEVSLSQQQLDLAGIKVSTLSPRNMDYQVYAPGEVKANGYTSYLVSPRVDSVVLRRHVTLGEHVKKGQPLVTLFSEAMVDAQAAYSIAASEWQRVKKMGRKLVDAKRYETAHTEVKAAFGRLIAFGLSEQAINDLDGSKTPMGEYSLNAEIDGAVLSDEFHQGQRIGAGEALIELADESQLWVDASLPADTNLTLPIGSKAQVKVGDDLVAATVTQEAHTIDRETRTRTVRLLINNTQDRFHAGMFAEVFFTFKTEKAVMAVPQTALMRSTDGDWQVFIEDEPGSFKAMEVSLGQSLGKWRVLEGVEPGLRLVTQGAFFVASQLAKGGFDPHNH
jgi:RND family efflux transporter MFP subunit